MFVWRVVYTYNRLNSRIGDHGNRTRGGCVLERKRVVIES